MNKKAIATPWIVAILAVAALLVVGTIFGVSVTAAAAAAAPLPIVDYDGEFDAVKFITAVDNTFWSDASVQATREDTTNDKWVGNVTLTNFTASGQDKRFDLYFEIDGGPVEELDDISLELVSGTLSTNTTISSMILYNYKTGTEIADFSDEIDDNDLDTSYDHPLATGKYVLSTVIHSLNIPVSSSIGCTSVYTLKIGAESDGDVTDIEMDIKVAQKTA